MKKVKQLGVIIGRMADTHGETIRECTAGFVVALIVIAIAKVFNIQISM